METVLRYFVIASTRLERDSSSNFNMFTSSARLITPKVKLFDEEILATPKGTSSVILLTLISFILTKSSITWLGNVWFELLGDFSMIINMYWTWFGRLSNINEVSWFWNGSKFGHISGAAVSFCKCFVKISTNEFSSWTFIGNPVFLLSLQFGEK